LAEEEWLTLVADSVSTQSLAWLLTLHPTASGRVYAAYGGVYIAVAMAWLWKVYSVPVTAWDLAGAAGAVAGKGIIVYAVGGPRVAANSGSEGDLMPSRRFGGVLLVAIFFAAATCILVGVGLALLMPGSRLESIWSLYPARRGLLMPYRMWLGPGFLLLAIIMALASIGCLRHRIWGWWLAIGIFLINGLSDAGQILLGHFLEGGIGVLVAGAILFYLSRPKVRGTFA
jgi:small multidrug resistance family-3 protein